MGDVLEQTRKQLNEFYNNMDKKQKIKVAISGLIVILSISMLMYYFSRPKYVTLYEELSAKKAGQITKKLDELRIPWKDDASGKVIYVPEEYKNKAKADLALEGIPSSRFSYDNMLNSSSLTMTNEERKKRFQIAQMNSLAKTIEAIEGINWAWVDLTVADDSNFISKDKKSKASVFVELQDGYELNKKQVDGIVMLVTNSVKGLDEESVSIVNNKGEVLTKTKDDQLYDTSTQLALQDRIQRELGNDIKSFLSKIYGGNNVDVLVNVKLDFDAKETNSVLYAPPIEDETNGIIRSMEELNEKSTNGPANGGVPGVDSNEGEVPQYVETTGGNSNHTKNNKVINYELNETRTRSVKAQGQVKDITVAVLINSEILPGKELTEENKKEIIEIVSASAGLDTKVVKVMGKKFDTTIADKFNQMKDDSNSNLLNSLPPWTMAVAGVFIIGLIGFAVFSVRRRKNQELKDQAATLDMVIDDEVDEIELSEKSEYKKQINKFVDKNPQAAAQLLKNWLNEE